MDNMEQVVRDENMVTAMDIANAVSDKVLDTNVTQTVHSIDWKKVGKVTCEGAAFIVVWEFAGKPLIKKVVGAGLSFLDKCNKAHQKWKTQKKEAVTKEIDIEYDDIESDNFDID